MKKLTLLALTLAVVMTTGNLVAVAETNYLAGKIIALDAGHDDVSYGASNTIDGVLVTEAEVNMTVVNALKSKLEEQQQASVVVADRLATRKDRVNDAIAKCAALDFNGDGVGDGRKCDVLISIHHNGSDDANYDGTLVIYNEKKDKPLAEKMLAALTPLTGNSDGLLNGGYGMTVYGNLVSVITEAYFITNDAKATRYLDLNDRTNGVSNLVLEEVDAQVKGISDYFASLSSGSKGGRPR